MPLRKMVHELKRGCFTIQKEKKEEGKEEEKEGEEENDEGRWRTRKKRRIWSRRKEHRHVSNCSW